MWNLIEPWLLVSAFVASGFIVGGARVACGRMRRKRRLLLSAESAGRTFFEALTRFCEDEAAPLRLKKLLVRIGERSGSDEFASFVAATVHRVVSEGYQSRGGGEDVYAQVQALAHERPDLAEAFYVALTSGLWFIVLRDPRHHSAAEVLASTIVPDRRREVAVAAAAVRRSRDHEGGDVDHHGMAVPA